MKAVFLDRDGVLNRKAPEGHYVTRWEEMEFLPGAREAVYSLNHAGFLVVVVSNQRCVAKGLVTSAQVDAMHARMRDEFETSGAKLDAIYYCPHENNPPCACRKPRPGMLFQAAQTYGVDLSVSWIVGDSDTDMEAGRTAGCRTARLVNDDDCRASHSDIVASSLLFATYKILGSHEALPQSRHIDGAAALAAGGGNCLPNS